MKILALFITLFLSFNMFAKGINVFGIGVYDSWPEVLNRGVTLNTACTV